MGNKVMGKNKRSGRGGSKLSNPLNLALDIVIGILCVVLVGAVAFAISSFWENYSYSYSEDSFYYRLEDKSYGQMVEMYYTNEAAGVKPGEDMREYYGVAKYFEAASYYKIYREAGDLQKAQEYHEKMETALEEMEELKFVGDKICEKLGKEE